MSDEIQYMDVKEFREFGYLQELNRTFLHPLGLALEVRVDDAGNESLGGIWDYRHDPEGISYGPGVIDIEKRMRMLNEWADRAEVRVERLGYVTQPVPEEQ